VAPDAVALVADPLVAVAPVVAAPDAVTPVADPLVADPPDAGAVEPQAESTPAPTSTTTLLNNGPRASRKHIDMPPSNGRGGWCGPSHILTRSRS
jgi:hypothetical protein